jgi:DNA-binding MarR family transcriptional regulator
VTRRQPQHDDDVTRVWQQLRAFVLEHDHRAELRETLGLGRGMGRIKVLMRLTEGPLTLRDIAEFTGVDAPYATLIVDNLEARGLVERTAHPGDRRRKLVTLTPAGQQAAAHASDIISQPPAGFTQLTDAELTLLESLLARLSGPELPAELSYQRS